MHSDFLTLLDRLQAKAVSAADVRVIDVPQLRQVIIKSGDAWGLHDIAAPARDATFDTFESLVMACNDKKFAPDPEIYVDLGDDTVTVLLDRGQRHDTAKLALVPSDRWQFISSLAGEKDGMEPQEWVRQLRFKLPDSGCENLIRALRKVDFRRRADGSVEVEHGRSSLGKSVENVVQGREDIPEFIDVKVSMFTDISFDSRVTIRLGIHIDVIEESVVIAPLADELARAGEAVAKRLTDELRAALPSLPVWSGSPKP